LQVPVSKQASTAYGVREAWKQELSTLIAIISRSASSWFPANYTVDQPGSFLIGKLQDEAIASSCLLLATPMLPLNTDTFLVVHFIGQHEDTEKC